MYYEYEFELEEFCNGRFLAVLWVEFDGEPAERRDTMNPGCPARINVMSAEVQHLEGETWDKNREELETSLGTDGLDWLDGLAMDEVNECVDTSGWLYDELVAVLHSNT